MSSVAIHRMTLLLEEIAANIELLLALLEEIETPMYADPIDLGA